MKNKKLGNFLLGAGALLLFAAVLIPLWRDYQYSKMPQSGAVGTGQIPEGELVITAQRRNYRAEDLMLVIPKLELEVTVQNGTDYETLKNGPGLYEYAQVPSEGEDGNVSIAGHRDIYGSHFYAIDTMEEGDLIYLVYQGKVYVYEYEKTEIVEPNDWSVIQSKGYPCVTLTSCDPIGTTLHRIIVTGRRTEIVDYSENFEFKPKNDK
jgi:LPXTG-site transpeptidase (sortase) family protein